MMPSNLEDNELYQKMQTLLISINRGYIQSYSISVVPEGLKILNHEVYMPRKVSIGPRFNNSRDELLLMEEVKLSCMLSVLHRGKDKADISFDKCNSAILKLDKDVRASYVVESKLKEAEHAKIMLLDGCFLLELLISNSGELDRELPCRYPGPAAEVLKDEDVLSDLMLFENQIPIVVLHKLSQTLFPEMFEADGEVKFEKTTEEVMKRQLRANFINNLALSVLRYSCLESASPEAPHILDLVHFFVNRTFDTGAESGDNHKIPMAPDTNLEKLKLKSCALRLRAAGVSIQVIGGENKMISCSGLITDCYGVFIRLRNLIVKTTKKVNIVAAEEMKGLDFEFKFNNGKLEIAKLHITKTTKAKWRNVIAWEHHKSNEKSSRGKFTLSALIFDGLICCDADLKFLKKKNIIVDDMNMSNEELKQFFRTMPLGVDPGVIDSTYVTMVGELNDYSPNKPFSIFSGFFKLLWHLLMIRLEWLVKFLKRNYNFVAAFFFIFACVRFFRSDITPIVKYISKSWINKNLCI